MSMSRKLLLGFVVFGLVLAVGAGAAYWWFAQQQQQPIKITILGSKTSDQYCSITSGHLVVNAPQPGMVIGTVTKPGNSEQITYVILFRYSLAQGAVASQGYNCYCNMDGKTAVGKNSIELGDKRLSAEFRMELNETKTAVVSEQLTIGGKPRDMNEGQVFLIDLAAEGSEYQQQKVELDAIPFKLDSTNTVEQFAETLRQNLASKNPEIKAFLHK